MNALVVGRKMNECADLSVLKVLCRYRSQSRKVEDYWVPGSRLNFILLAVSDHATNVLDFQSIDDGLVRFLAEMDCCFLLVDKRHVNRSTTRISESEKCARTSIVHDRVNVHQSEERER